MATKVRKRKKPEPAPEKAGLSFDNIDQVKELLSGMSLELGGFGFQRQVEQAENILAAQAIEAEPSAIKTHRLIIDPKLEAYKDCQRVKTACREWFYSVTLPYPVKGVRLFRKDIGNELRADAMAWEERLNEAAGLLTAMRPRIIEWARTNLGKAFSAALYPKDFRDSYTLKMREHSIEPPSYLSATNAESYKRELVARMGDIEQGMRTFERQCTAQIGMSVSRLMAGMNGDVRLMGSNLDQMRKVFARIAAMKFQGTAVFNEAMAGFRDAVDGVGAVELRRPGGVKEETEAKLKSLMERHKSLLAESQKAVATGGE